MKYRDPNGVRVVAHTATRHTLDDVIGALQAYLDRLRAERAAA